MSIPFFVVVPQRGTGDCGIATLATLLSSRGVTYEDVLEASIAETPKAHHRGLWISQIEKAAARLGVTLSRKRKFNVDEDTGILVVEMADRGRHVVLLTDGVLVDCKGAGTVYMDPNTYIADGKVGPLLRLEGQ